MLPKKHAPSNSDLPLECCSNTSCHHDSRPYLHGPRSLSLSANIQHTPWPPDLMEPHCHYNGVTDMAALMTFVPGSLLKDQCSPGWSGTH